MAFLWSPTVVPQTGNALRGAEPQSQPGQLTLYGDAVQPFLPVSASGRSSSSVAEKRNSLDCSEHVKLSRSLVLSSLTEFFRKMSGNAESCLLSYTDSTRMFIICSFRTFTKYTLDTLLDVLINVFYVVQGI